jgi:hypothetical protein
MPTVTIAEVKQPDEGKKKGKIWDINGNTWGVWRDDIKLFKPGNKYTFDQKPNPWQGKIYYDVDGKTIKQVGRDEDPRQVEMPVVTNGKARQQSYGGKSPTEQKQIWTMAIIKSFTEHPTDPMPRTFEALDDHTAWIGRVWEMHFGEVREEGP